MHATLKHPLKNLENPTVMARRASVVCQVLVAFLLTGYECCRAFVKHALLSVTCICVSLSFPPVCVHIPSSWVNLAKDKAKACDVQHPVLLSYRA